MAQKINSENNDSDMLNLPDGCQIRRDHLRQLYESVGVKFGDDGKATLVIGDSSAIQSIEVDEDMLFRPVLADWEILNAELTKALGGQIELFDPTDDSHEFVRGANRYKNLGRVFHHVEYTCCPIRQRRYYTYLTLEAPASMSNTNWEKIAQYVVCVIAAIGLVVLLSLLPGGQVVIANFMSIVAVIAAGCLVLASGLSTTAKNQAFVRKFVGR